MITIRKSQISNIERALEEYPDIRLGPTSRVSLLQVDEVAHNVFFDNFPIMGDSCKRVRLSATQSSYLTPSVTSVGLATLAIAHEDHEIMDLAMRKYSVALNRLSGAIRDSIQVDMEQLVATSYTLAIFEV